MEETYNLKALILNRQSFRESDSKVTLYSSGRGKLVLVARGTKKINSKLAGHLEPICLAKIMAVRGRRYDYVGSAFSQNCYSNIKEDLEKLPYAGQAVSIVNKVIKENESLGAEIIFGLLDNYLGALNQRSRIADCELLYNFFILKLLVALGYKPELHGCLVCRKKLKPGGNFFSLNQGGVVCRACGPKDANNELTISDDCLKVIRLSAREDFFELIKMDTGGSLKKEIILLIRSFFQFNIDNAR